MIKFHSHLIYQQHLKIQYLENHLTDVHKFINFTVFLNNFCMNIEMNNKLTFRPTFTETNDSLWVKFRFLHFCKFVDDILSNIKNILHGNPQLVLTFYRD